MITLQPRLEEWVLKIAHEVNIPVEKLGLPENAVKLHERVNVNLDKFERLIEDVKGSSKLYNEKTTENKIKTLSHTTLSSSKIT